MENNQTLISIIMPSLNVKEFMEECISVFMKNICVDEAHRPNTWNNQ